MAYLFNGILKLEHYQTDHVIILVIHMMTFGNDNNTFDLKLYETIIGNMKNQINKMNESRNLH